MAPIRAEASTGTITVDPGGAGLTVAGAGTVLKTATNSYAGSLTFINGGSAITTGNLAVWENYVLPANWFTTIPLTQTAVTETSDKLISFSSGNHAALINSINLSGTTTPISAQNSTLTNATTLISQSVPTLQLSAGAKVQTKQPISFTFSTTQVGKSSKGTWMNIKYAGTGSLTVAAAQLTGAQAADFQVSPSAPVTLVEGGQVAIEVSFVPLAGGQRAALASFTLTEDSNPPSLIELAISGPAVALSSNANLATLRLYADGLRVSGRDLNTFVSPNISGTLDAAVDYTRLYAIPVVQDSNARVTVNGVATASGAYSAPMTMKIGDNPVTVVVTAEDGVTTQTYMVGVTRGSFQRIAQRFGQAKGITDGATIRQFYDVSINSTEGVAYTGQLVGGMGGAAADSAVWSTGLFKSLALVLRSGEDLGGGQTIGRDLLFPRISNDGRSSLSSNVGGTGPMRVGQWMDNGFRDVYLGAYQTSVFEAPPAFHAFTGFSYTTQQQRNGLTCFAANLVPGGRGSTKVSTLNDSGLWALFSLAPFPSAYVTASAREGETLPTAVGRGLVQGEVLRAAMGAYDYAVYSGYVRGAGVTSSNAEVVLARDIIKRTGPLLIARTGAQAAGLPKGVKYYNFLGEGGHSEEITFWAQLTGPGVTAENNRALFQSAYPGTGMPTRLLLRDDDDLSRPFGPGVKFRNVLAFWALANGAVVVQGQLKGTGITAANDVFVARLSDTPVSMMVIAREGDVVGGAGNSNIDTIQQADVSLFGQVAILCSLVNGTGDTAANLNNQVLLRRNIFVSDPLEALLRKGAPLAGGTSPVYSIQMTKNVVQGNTGSTTGMSRAVNDKGKVAVIVTTMDNNQGVFVGP